MKIRLGYACINKTIDKNFKTVNYTNFKDDYDKLNKVIKHNLDTLYEILFYNYTNGIHFYRITSNLIPLIDHPNIDKSKINKFDYEFYKIKKLVKQSSMRVDMHASEYIVINSVKKEVVAKAIISLKEIYKLLKRITDKPYIVLHIGSNVFGKKLSKIRFVNSFKKLPLYLRKCIIIENDDKVFNINDILEICEQVKIPCVFDYHHHICNHEDLTFNVKKICKTWNFVPKMHISSPKSERKSEFRSHHDFIDIDDFINFINKFKKCNIDIDVMIEAKEKDVALFKLVRELKYKNFKFIDETTIEI